MKFEQRALESQVTTIRERVATVALKAKNVINHLLHNRAPEEYPVLPESPSARAIAQHNMLIGGLHSDLPVSRVCDPLPTIVMNHTRELS